MEGVAMNTLLIVSGMIWLAAVLLLPLLVVWRLMASVGLVTWPQATPARVVFWGMFLIGCVVVVLVSAVSAATPAP
jgi:hypothetical protein